MVSSHAADLLWRHSTGVNALWFLQDAGRYHASSVEPMYDAGWKIVGVGPFNDAGGPDILWRHTVSGRNVLWLMDEWATSTPAAQHEIEPCDPIWSVVGLGDFNGDGQTDIVWRDTVHGANAIWFMNGMQRIGSQLIEANYDLGWEIRGVADFNGDGKPDLLWRHKTLGRCAVWFIDLARNPTGGVVGSAYLNPELTDLEWKISAVGDFNGDDLPDIVWRHPRLGLNAVWYMNGVQRTGSDLIAPTVADPGWEIVGSGGMWRSVSAAARTTLSPPAVVLQWRNQPPVPVTLQKKGPGGWVVLATNVLRSTFTDTKVQVGQTYEYLVGQRYLAVGLQAPPVESRGRVVLLVDQTLATALTNEIAQLQDDLRGDGWKVVYHTAPRHDDVTWSNNPPRIDQVKAMLTADYNAAPAETKAVFILGHVAIPYMGFTASDGHNYLCSDPLRGLDHKGAWPADPYYGEIVGGTWTDSISRDNCDFPENDNFPGDRKYDQEVFSTPLELATGRVDFARLPAFGVKAPVGATPDPRELQLLRQYLAKDHQYRHRIAPQDFSSAQRVVSMGKFANGTVDDSGVNAKNRFQCWVGLRAAAAWLGYGPGKLVAADAFTTTNKFLLGVQGGWGCPSAINCGFPDQHSSADLANPAKEPLGAFYLLFGSYFGDWNMVDDLLRAVLATPRYGLGVLWSSKNWGLQRMALGDPIGLEVRRTMNENDAYYPGDTPGRETALLGDPTLRLHVTAPPSGLVLKTGATNLLSWVASPEAGATYWVYGADRRDGDYVRLTPSPLATNQVALPARRVYQVRALTLKAGGAGSYTNLSQGIFLNAP